MTRLLLCVLVLAGLALLAALPAKSVVEQEVPMLLQKVETQRGQPLTSEQRREFSHTTALLREALQPARQNFARSVADIFNLPPDKVQALLPTIGATNTSPDQSLISQIETSLGRAITAQELQQLRIADNAKQAEMNEVLARYAGDLARIAGLSAEQVRRIFPTMGL